MEEEERDLIRRLDKVERAAERGPWPFEIPEAAADLFEALPDAFTFDRLLEAAERLQIGSEEAAGYLRTFQAEEMITSEGERFTKAGRIPYF